MLCSAFWLLVIHCAWFVTLCTGGDVVGLQVPMMAARFTGTGDLFTSLYLAWSEHGVKVRMCSCMDSCGIHLCD